MRRPVIVASENGRQGAAEAMQLLRKGGTALDAVELACRVVEDDPNEHSVGYSGLPNVNGDVELDASIMDGATLRTGAVAALYGYGNPITLARRVMEELPHVLMVGRGAEQFAQEMGYTPASQRTEEAQRRYAERFAERNVTPDGQSLRATTRLLTGPLNLQDRLDGTSHPLREGFQETPKDPGAHEPGCPRGAEGVERIQPDVANTTHHGKDDTLGTVNFLALDQHGNLASAVSTSGLGWKYPGRVGDSPIVGAGNYCDNRYGSAACTGMGELAIRVSTARSVVLYMKMGMSMQEAGLEVLRDLAYLQSEQGQYINIVTLTPTGEHAAFTTVPGRQYIYITGEMDEPEVAARLMLP